MPQRLLIAAVRAYRFALSPWLAAQCRYEPSCSGYALQALQRHGAAAGTYLALHRVCRCNPLSRGGYDPVADEPPRLFRSLRPRDAGRRADPAPPPSTDKTLP